MPLCRKLLTFPFSLVTHTNESCVCVDSKPKLTLFVLWQRDQKRMPKKTKKISKIESNWKQYTKVVHNFWRVCYFGILLRRRCPFSYVHVCRYISDRPNPKTFHLSSLGVCVCVCVGRPTKSTRKTCNVRQTMVCATALLLKTIHLPSIENHLRWNSTQYSSSSLVCCHSFSSRIRQTHSSSSSAQRHTDVMKQLIRCRKQKVESIQWELLLSVEMETHDNIDLPPTANPASTPNTHTPSPNSHDTSRGKGMSRVRAAISWIDREWN